MKKSLINILSLLFALVIILSTWNVIKVEAVSTTLSASSKTVTEGDTFSVSISSSISLAGWTISVSDNGGCTFQSATGGEVSGSTVYGTSVNGTKSLATYTFKAPSVDKKTTIKIQFSASEMTDNTSEVNEVDSASCTATITVNPKASSGGSSEGSSENNKPAEEEPEEKVSFSSVNETVYATASVNVRSSYSTSSSIIGGLDEGQSVTRTGIGDNGWSRISYNGSTAYVSSDYLTKTKPKEETENKDDEKEKEEEKSTNKNLSSLKVTPSGLTPEFDANTTQYTMTVGSNIDKLDIEAIAEDEKAKVEITGNEELKLGDNIIKIAVTAEDGTVRTYMITVTKEETVQFGLSELSIEGITLTPEFSTGVYEYTANTDNKELKELNITTKASDEDAKIEIIGNSDFKEGENVITILVSQGEETVTYQIKLNIVDTPVETPQENNNMIYYIGGAILAVIILVIIIVVVKKRKSGTRDEEDDNFTYYSQIKTNTEDSKDEVKEEDNTVNNNSNTENFNFEDDETPKKKKGKHF